jgi:ribonuclease P protein component
MLVKARRLSALEVKDVLKRGRSRRATYLSVKLISSNIPLKTSVIVPKSVEKGAVGRNRLRRAVYHALTPFSGSGQAIVFVQRKPVEKLQAAFTVDLKHLLSGTL